METVKFEKIGKMVELDGKYWGKQYEDGHSTGYGYGSIEKAHFDNSEFFNKPTDITYNGSPYVKELSKGKVITVKRTTIYEGVENE